MAIGIHNRLLVFMNSSTVAWISNIYIYMYILNVLQNWTLRLWKGTYTGQWPIEPQEAYFNEIIF